jgi:hypothetical protein
VQLGGGDNGAVGIAGLLYHGQIRAQGRGGKEKGKQNESGAGHVFYRDLRKGVFFDFARRDSNDAGRGVFGDN